MNPTTIIRAGGGLVTNQNNKLLLIFRNNRWDLPKGKLEPHEDIETCALREVCEECGLDSKHLTISRFIVETRHNYMLDNIQIEKLTSWYAMQYKGSEELMPQTEEGITAVGWYSHAEASNLLATSYPTIQEVFNHNK